MARTDPGAGATRATERVAAVRAARSLDDDRQLSTFAELLLARAGSPLQRLGDESLAALVRGTFQFLAQPGRTLRARAYAPSRARDGWEVPCAVLETLVGDQAFVVDTVREALAAEGIEPRLLLHPILAVRRDASGRLLAVDPPGTDGRQESLLHVWLPRLPADMLHHLAEQVAARLDDLRIVNEDFLAIRSRARATAAELEATPAHGAEAEGAAELLRWLADGWLELLGWREYAIEGEGADATIRVRAGSGLGLLRQDARSRYASPRRLADLAVPAQARLRGALLAVDKTRAVAPVHRRAHMDDVTILERDASGRVVGLRRLLGLLSAKAHADEASQVPTFRRVLHEILAADGAVPDSHDWKTIAGIFDALPKTEVLGSTAGELAADVHAIAAAEQGEATVVSIAPRRDGRYARVLVLIRPERVSGEAAARVGRLVRQRLGGTIVEEHLQVAEEERGRLFLRVLPDAHPLAPEVLAALEPLVAAEFESWEDGLRAVLVAQHGSDGGERLATRWASAFPPDYRATMSADDAAADVARLDGLVDRDAITVAFERSRRGAGTVLRVYRHGEPLVLADVLPSLEHLGVRVLGEDRVVVTPADGGTRALHWFEACDRHGAPLDVAAVAERAADAVLAVWAGRAGDDVLNRLVLEAALDWRAVEALRAYAGWVAQAGLGARDAIWAALADHPEPAARLYDCFAARCGGRGDEGRAREAFVASLEAVESLRADRLLRALLAAVQATVRTNFFARQPSSDVLSIKLSPRALQTLPPPQPLYEIYVRAPGVEGAHLRAGRVARGGLRLSDRPEDFRTEVLSLVRTQTVKNALIVPTGAKGAFVARGATSPVEAYRTFVGALLELTDDLVRGEVVHPPGVVVLDGPDPYLVVAADKGTATFSDVANAIATGRGFWLGDAFASGGSHGYDHKALGVTARGVWECVRIHCRNLGIDADRAPLALIGIGDMSGDVFGNGLLRSPHVRLRAAFDHRHVFLDPDPDPARSFAERSRLFEARGGWDAYDRTVLSPGAMIVARAAKRVALTPEVQRMLELPEPEASGEALVRAVLGMEADVLWNGGIGTYVRAPDEPDAAVGDPANDGVRATADALRVKVVAEGGNLGLTQRARVTFALRGGQVNTDTVDNSAGVDTSDHEVNLKICLQPLVAAGRIDEAERNRLLLAVRDRVVASVLAHNARQSRLLTVDQVRSRTRLEDFLEHAIELERASELDRAFERLPDRDVLRARRQTYLGLTRPELAVLAAYTKIRQQQELLASDLPDDPLLEAFLLGYFPTEIVERFPDAVRGHRLRREIVVTELVGRLVDACGATFVHRLRRASGATVVEAVRAWAVAWRIVGGADVAAAVEAAPLAMDDDVAAWLALESATERASRWLLAHAPAATPAATLAERLGTAVAEVRAAVGGAAADAAAARSTAFERAGLGAAAARALGDADRVADLLDVALAARTHGLGPDEAAARYRALGECIDFDWLVARVAELIPADRFERRAQAALTDDLLEARRRLMARPVGDLPPQALAVVADLLGDLRAAPRVSLPALLVVAREIRRLADSLVALSRPERTEPW